MSKYKLTNNGDNTLKQFFDRFYVIPRDKQFNDEQLQFLESNCFIPADEGVLAGKNGYIIFRLNQKKVSKELQEIIRNDKGSCREKAKKYKLSIGTISKIMNNKY